MLKSTLCFAFLALALSVTTSQGQDHKAAKKAAVTEAKAEVSADKAQLDANKIARRSDKQRGDKIALRADRKTHLKEEGKLVKDQLKKDGKVVKEKL